MRSRKPVTSPSTWRTPWRLSKAGFGSVCLGFFSFASDDGDVNDRSLSRLETLLEDEEDWPLYLQMTTVDSLADLVIGHIGFKEKHDGQWMNFGSAAVIVKMLWNS